MPCKLKVGGACLNQTPIHWKNNLNNIKNVLKEAKKDEVDILCLPELCITGYGCEDLFLSTWLLEKALNQLHQIAPLTENIAVCVGLPIRIEKETYNTTCFVSNKEIKGFYAKQKLAKNGVHYESRWFTPWTPKKIINFSLNGNSYPFGHITLEHRGITIGFEICEDAWQAELPVRNASKVHLILNASASHFAFGKTIHREQEIVLKRSKQLDCVYLYVNLLGNEAGQMIYDGDILIGQQGKLIGHNRRLSFKNYDLLSVVVDFERNQAKTNIQETVLSRNEEFGKAASLALFDYLRKSKSKGFVLSLSGGADSSANAVLVAEVVRNGLKELGFEEFQRKIGFKLKGKHQKDIVNQILTTAYQQTVHSSEKTFHSAEILAKSLGSVFYNWRIDEQINAYRSTIEKAIQRPLTWDHDDVTLQNIQARSRSPIIWMLANIRHALLLATSNRSEGDVGYATMDGDTSGSISPLAGVSKPFILQWLLYAEKTLGYEGLSKVNQLIPTAELQPKDLRQTDEDDIMPYEILLKIEQEAIYHGKSPAQVMQTLRSTYPPATLVEWIKKFFRLWAKNQWKRERLAPSFHFDDFNINPRSWYRFPILSGGYDEELKSLNHANS